MTITYTELTWQTNPASKEIWKFIAASIEISFTGCKFSTGTGTNASGILVGPVQKNVVFLVTLKSGHSEILIMSFVSIGALYCVFLKH